MSKEPLEKVDIDFVKKLFEDNKSVQSYILKCAHAHIRGWWHYDGYQYSPRGVIRGGMKFYDEWNTNNYTYIYITESPEIKFIESNRGTPKPATGTEKCVWSYRSGWLTNNEAIRSKIMQTFLEMINDYVEYENFRIAREEEEDRAKKEAIKRKNKAISNAWSQ